MQAPDATETAVFLEALKRRHGYDFSGYAPSSLRRRLQLLVVREGAADLAALIPPLLRDAALLPRVLAALLVPVSGPFRDPVFFSALRETVLPMLRSYPEITIWHAGCASGEEVYSVAICLHEAGLLDKAHIFATDIGDHLLTVAESGVLAPTRALEFATAYARAGGQRAFTDYCTLEGQRARMAPFLRQRISFVHHNLTTDGVFCEAQLILCRNVLIYFDHELRQHALSLFTDSLVRGGYLCLGLKEDVRFSVVGERFDTASAAGHIFRKKQLTARMAA